MTDANVGVAVVWTSHGVGVVPVVEFPAPETDRQKAASETGKAALLLSKTTAAQAALFRWLAERAPNGRYIVPRAQWIETVLEATTDVEERDVPALFTFDWTPESMTPQELRTRVLEALRKRR